MKQSQVLLDLQLLPCLEYFVCLSSYPGILIDKHEHYVKQSYRNRFYIRISNQVMPLTIPVQQGSQRLPMSEVRIDYRQKWQQLVLRSISSAYGKAPFYEYFVDDIAAIFMKGEERLFNMSRDLLTICLKFLRMDVNICYTERYLKEGADNIDDLRGRISPKSASNLGIYHPQAYNQIFGNNFVGNLSIMDLLFCEGPNAVEILKKSTIK